MIEKSAPESVDSLILWKKEKSAGV